MANTCLIRTILTSRGELHPPSYEAEDGAPVGRAATGHRALDGVAAVQSGGGEEQRASGVWARNWSEHVKRSGAPLAGTRRACRRAAGRSAASMRERSWSKRVGHADARLAGARRTCGSTAGRSALDVGRAATTGGWAASDGRAGFQSSVSLVGGLHKTSPN